jgi:hypothetical protein
MPPARSPQQESAAEFGQSRAAGDARDRATPISTHPDVDKVTKCGMLPKQGSPDDLPMPPSMRVIRAQPDNRPF